MHFINGDRRVEAVSSFARLALNDFFWQAANQRCGFRAHLGFKGVGIGLNTQFAVGIDHLELIELAVMRTGNKQLPDPALPPQPHRVATAIPVIKLANDGNATRVGCPDRKAGAGDAVHRIRMRAQGFVRPQMGSFRQQPTVHILQQRAKTVGIVNQVLLTVPGDRQLIAKRIFTPGNNATKETTGIQAIQNGNFTPGFGFNNPRFGGIGQERANLKAIFRTVHAENGKRIRKVPGN